MERVAVILAGGGGTRFWPLSRQNKPKQFLNLNGTDIMLNDTIKRYEGIISQENTFIVSNCSQAELLEKMILKDVPNGNILREPLAKNTAACVLYAALTLKKRYNDAVMVVLPSDHHIADVARYRESLEEICYLAEETDKLMTFGIKPSFPATGYGYIKINKCNIFKSAYEVAEFVEKPTFEKAREYVDSGNYFWNSGMFTWKVSVIIDSFKRFLPRLYNSMYAVYDYIGSEKEVEIISDIYPALQNISIDYGILERSDNVLVVPGDFGWNDVGSWDMLGAIIPPDEQGNIIKAKHVGVNTKDSIVYGMDKLIATVSVEGLIVIDVDDAILVCPKSDAQTVKQIVEILKENGMSEYI